MVIYGSRCEGVRQSCITSIQGCSPVRIGKETLLVPSSRRILLQEADVIRRLVDMLDQPPYLKLKTLLYGAPLLVG
jgi:hypothetical protein